MNCNHFSRVKIHKKSPVYALEDSYPARSPEPEEIAGLIRSQKAF